MTLSPFTATVQAHDRMIAARLAAGWDFDPDYGWGSPDGITEHDWEHVLGYPLPEDPDFREWASALYHYDALDAGVPDPFPPAPAA